MHPVDLVHKAASFAFDDVEIELPPFRRRSESRTWEFGQRVQRQTIYDETNPIAHPKYNTILEYPQHLRLLLSLMNSVSEARSSAQGRYLLYLRRDFPNDVVAKPRRLSEISPSVLRLPKVKGAHPDTLLTSLRGQKVFVEDLNILFTGWPCKVNVHLERLREDVDAWLESLLGDSKLLQPLRTADFGFFGATWWPEADWERLKIATYLATWVGSQAHETCTELLTKASCLAILLGRRNVKRLSLAEEFDSDDGSLWDDFERSQAVRDKTLGYVRSCLNLSGSQCHEDPPSRIVGGFETIGEAIRKAYNVGMWKDRSSTSLLYIFTHFPTEQRERFWREIARYVDMSQCEQSIRLSKKLPTVDEFWGYRLGSSAVCVTLAINE
ncbi:MAG: hypothetical protein Q9170_004184 [Blastenia crenularia]